MRCFYYLAPTLDSTQQISDDLHDVGVRDFFIHVICKDESGLKRRHIHSSNYLETLDIIREGFIGAAIGFFAGLIGATLLNYFGPFENVPGFVYVAVVGLITLFGAWEGGLVGIANENKKLAKFHDEVEAGQYLILIYARKEQETAVRETLSERHPEAELVGIDTHFVNPFSMVKRRRAAAAGRAELAQRE